MSAYSDWKCGALTDEEYRYEMRRECGDPDDIPFWSEEGEEYDEYGEEYCEDPGRDG